MIYLNSKRIHRRRDQCNDPGFYHLYSRKIDGSQLFIRQSDFKKFLITTEEARKKFHAIIIIVVCMSNHFHMIASSKDIMGFKTFINRKFSGWYNMKYHRKGPVLYESTIKASRLPYADSIRDRFLYNANNPVKAKLSRTAFTYKYSSMKIFSLRPWVWKELITIDREYILSLFGSLDNLKDMLRKEMAYKDTMKKIGRGDGVL